MCLRSSAIQRTGSGNKPSKASGARPIADGASPSRTELGMRLGLRWSRAACDHSSAADRKRRPVVALARNGGGHLTQGQERLSGRFVRGALICLAKRFAGSRAGRMPIQSKLRGSKYVVDMKIEAMPTKTEFKFNCPACGQHILAASEWSGRRINCPSCEATMTIPSPPKEANEQKRA